MIPRKNRDVNVVFIVVRDAHAILRETGNIESIRMQIHNGRRQ